MSRKSVLMAIGLITVGIIFGVVLVSSFSSGIRLGFARGDQDVKLGGRFRSGPRTAPSGR